MKTLIVLFLCLALSSTHLPAQPNDSLLVPRGEELSLENVFFAREHEQLYLQDSHGVTYLWNLEAGTINRYQTKQKVLLTGLGARLVFVREVLVEMIKEGQLEHSFELQMPDSLSAIQQATLSPFSILLAVVQEDAVTVYNIRNGKRRHHFVLNGQSVGQVAFSPNGKYLAVSLYSGQVITWETKTWQPVDIWTSTRTEPPRLAWHPTTPVLLCAERSNLFFRDVANDLEWRLREETGQVIQKVAVHPIFDQLATLVGGSQLRLHHYRTGEKMHSVDLDMEQGEYLSFSADGRLFAVADKESVHIYDAATAKQIVSTTLHALRQQANRQLVDQRAAQAADLASQPEEE